MKILAMTCCCTDVYPEKNVIVAGGNALNVGANCKLTNLADVYLMGNIGTDAFGKVIKEVAKQYELNVDRLYEVNGESAHNIVYIADNGDRYFKTDSWHNGVYGEYRISEEDAAFMQTMDVIATTRNDPNLKEIIEIRRKGQFVLAVDFLDWDLDEAWELWLDAIDLFFISGKKRDLPKLKEWSIAYPKNVFVATLGEEGSIAYKAGNIYTCKAVEVEQVVDTTGCGDSYQGTFIAYYIETGDIEQAMEEGSKAAAKTLGFVGALQKK